MEIHVVLGDQMIVGSAAATVGLLAALPTIGASGTPAAVSISTAGLIGIGILLPTASTLQLRRALDRNRTGARPGLAMQALIPFRRVDQRPRGDFSASGKV